MGVKYDIIFPIGERRISLRGWQNAFAQCSYFMHLFLIPSNQGASCTQLHMFSLRCLLYILSLPFSNPFSTQIQTGFSKVD